MVYMAAPAPKNNTAQLILIVCDVFRKLAKHIIGDIEGVFKGVKKDRIKIELAAHKNYADMTEQVLTY
jgi:hypothetical protein